jgi:elongator complex protein 3
MAETTKTRFDPRAYEPVLVPLIEALLEAPDFDDRRLTKTLNRFPKGNGETFSKHDLIQGVRTFGPERGWNQAEALDRLRMKPMRTHSGVTPVTVLTEPFPCPGKCVFCPNDLTMPKSYLAMEPGAQRAALHRFDPYAQTQSRMVALHGNGHPVDKVELIVLGGTWSFYPEPYQRWFIGRCFEAVSQFEPTTQPPPREESQPAFDAFGDLIDGRNIEASYNERIGTFLRKNPPTGRRSIAWEELMGIHRTNEAAPCRVVGLSIETRPDYVTEDEVVRIRRLGVTKVQIGVQSLSDEILSLNKRGHDVDATRDAFARLRAGGFKVQAHFMPNLYGATPESDIEDFRRLFGDPSFRPDELKIYPCSLIESAELMQHYEASRWRPYTEAELLHVLGECLPQVPEYCRVSRVIRDIPSHDIVVGNQQSNFREKVDLSLHETHRTLRDIRSREIRRDDFHTDTMTSGRVDYETRTTREIFLSRNTTDGRLLAFLRLSLPRQPGFIKELRGSAIIREVHVYGRSALLGEHASEKPQHRGLGADLIRESKEVAASHGFPTISVIAAVGTRAYYRRHEFEDGALYMQAATGPDRH